MEQRSIRVILFLVLSPCIGNGAQNFSATEAMMNALQSPWNNWRPYLQEKLAFFPGVLSFTRSHYKTITALALVAGVSVYAWKKWRDTRPRPQHLPPITQVLGPSLSVPPPVLRTTPIAKGIHQELQENFAQLIEEFISQIWKKIQNSGKINSQDGAAEGRVIAGVLLKALSIRSGASDLTNTMFTMIYIFLRKRAQDIQPNNIITGIEGELKILFDFFTALQGKTMVFTTELNEIHKWLEQQVQKKIMPLIKQLQPEELSMQNAISQLDAEIRGIKTTIREVEICSILDEIAKQDVFFMKKFVEMFNTWSLCETKNIENKEDLIVCMLNANTQKVQDIKELIQYIVDSQMSKFSFAEAVSDPLSKEVLESLRKLLHVL